MLTPLLYLLLALLSALNLSTGFQRPFTMASAVRRSVTGISMNQKELMKELGEDISRAIGGKYSPIEFKNSFAGGGGGASVGSVVDSQQREYFVKMGNINSFDMLRGEFEGTYENVMKFLKAIIFSYTNSFGESRSKDFIRVQIHSRP